MSVRPIVLYSANPEILRRVSDPVQDGLGDVTQLVTDLVDTLLQHGDGVGLAAPQIGIHKRVIVVCLGAGPSGTHGPPIAIVDPVIVEAARAQPHSDGCLSFPGLYGETVRPHFLRLCGFDREGSAREWTLEGFDAVVAHHEIDHLNGVLFVDRLSSRSKLYTAGELRTS